MWNDCAGARRVGAGRNVQTVERFVNPARSAESARSRRSRSRYRMVGEILHQAETSRHSQPLAGQAVCNGSDEMWPAGIRQCFPEATNWHIACLFTGLARQGHQIRKPTVDSQAFPIRPADDAAPERPHNRKPMRDAGESASAEAACHGAFSLRFSAPRRAVRSRTVRPDVSDQVFLQRGDLKVNVLQELQYCRPAVLPARIGVVPDCGHHASKRDSVSPGSSSVARR